MYGDTPDVPADADSVDDETIEQGPAWHRATFLLEASTIVLNIVRRPGGRQRMVIIHDLDPESVAKMIQVDLSSVDGEPESPIGNFPLHGCTGGVAAFRGRPPWEFHGQGDELLLILAGNSELTVLEE